MNSNTSLQKSEIKVIEPSLPKGGGTIKGMGEEFAPHEFSGAASLSIPIPSTACRGMSPQLSIQYSTGNANSSYGYGWSLSLSHISRQTTKGVPRYDDSDTFLLAGDDYLIKDLKSENPDVTINDKTYGTTRYVPRVEGNFSLIDLYINKEDDTDQFWKVTSASNTVTIFGKSESAKVFDPKDASRIFKWLPEEVYDDKGNHRIYIYSKDSAGSRNQNAEAYLSKVKYGNQIPIVDGSLVLGTAKALLSEVQWHFEIGFDYGEYDLSPTRLDNYSTSKKPDVRLDSFSEYVAGFEIRNTRLLSNVLIFHRFNELDKSVPVLVSQLKLGYEQSPLQTKLINAQHIGWQLKGKKSSKGEENEIYATRAMPPLKMEYTSFQAMEEGCIPDVFEPLGGDDWNFQLTDLYSEGIPGLLYTDGESVLYRQAESISDNQSKVTYGKLSPVSFPPGKRAGDALHVLSDVTGNGLMDLVINESGQAGFYEIGNDQTWKNFVPFQSYPSDFQNRHNQLADVTGDGLADVVLVDLESVKYNSSERASGYSDSVIRPRANELPVSYESGKTKLVSFANFLGAGSAQRVEIQNNSVKCWPGLGYGEFGEAVELENAPDFDPDFQISRLFLTDLDGNGYTDLAYVYPDRVEVFLNQSGNSFAKEPIKIQLPETWTPLDRIQFADVLGNGTSCLVFTKMAPKSKIFYLNLNYNKELDLTQKPHLLSCISNNLGASTLITYSSSVQYYLRDKALGKDWVTNLPFPVNVVKQVKSQDEISGTSTIGAYSYSHGYYDGVEREFRGFGFVGRTDRHDFNQQQPAQNAEDAAYEQAPLVTKTWYHTGADKQEAALISAYRKEYWQGDSQALKMPNDVFVLIESTGDEAAEHGAHRALHGAVLRTEVYGKDATDWQDIPYSVSESEYEVIEVQSKGDNKYAVFRTQQRQSIHYDYERNAHDPMVSHNFVLETDHYGHVLKSASVEYGRRGYDNAQDQTGSQQGKIWVNYGEHDLKNYNEDRAYYLLGVPFEQRAFEIKNLRPAQGIYFSFNDLKTSIALAMGEDDQNTLLHWSRDYYYDGNKGQELALGQITIPLLHHRTEQVVFDKEGLAAMKELPDNLDTMLTRGDTGIKGAHGGYISFPSSTDPETGRKPSAYYWNPGSSQSCHGSEAFYRPKAFYDAFQQSSSTPKASAIYSYDTYGLMIESVTDILGNQVVMSGFDYVQMHAKRTTDANANWSEIATDPLGMVFATAHGGQQGDEHVNFKLDGVEWDPAVTAEDLINNPSGYLKKAASYFYYDLHCWEGSKKTPAHIVHLNYPEYTSRVDEDKQKEIVHKTISYSDGFGRALQAKAYLNTQEDVRFWTGTEVVTETKPDCWLTSGAVIYNNKGKAIKEYEPFYAEDWSYLGQQRLNQVGYSTTLFYDAIGRVVLTQSADGFFTKTLFGVLKNSDSEQSFDGYLNRQLYANLGYQKYNLKGESAVSLTELPVDVEGGFPQGFNPNPWSTLHYDANDCSAMIKSTDLFGQDVDASSLVKAQVFANTPHQSIVGSNGQVVESRQLNVGENEQNINYTTFDAYGHALTQTDQRLFSARTKNNPQLANFTTTYNLGTPVKVVSVDAGTSWSLSNVAGQGFYRKDSREFEQFTLFDVKQRPLKVIVTGGSDGTLEGEPKALNLNNVVKRIQYGDDPAVTWSKEDLQKANLIGKVLWSLDESGLHAVPAYSVMGAPLCNRQWIRKEYKAEANWAALVKNDLQGLNKSLEDIFDTTGLSKLALAGTVNEAMLADNFTTSSKHNAIGEILKTIDADGNVESPLYDTLGREVSISTKPGSVVVKLNPGITAPETSEIRYNAKGQQVREASGHGLVTLHNYDPRNFRLTNIVSTFKNKNLAIAIKQDLTYHHDPVGNVCSVTNNALPTVYFKQQKVAPKADYTYDSLYRLITATGREQAGQWENTQQNQGKEGKAFFEKYISQKENGQALQSYTQQFDYDTGGNLITQQGTGATRTNTIELGSNRLEATAIGKISKDCQYDVHGNMLTLSGTNHVTWNYRDNMASAVQIVRPDGVNDTEYYIYDGSGNRVRKISEQLGDNGSTKIVEVLYAGGIEIRRSGSSSKWDKVWHNVKMLQGRAIHCLWRYQIKGSETGPATSQQRFQLTDLLDSSNYEVDKDGNLITYEEFYPYGGAAIITGKNATEVKNKHYRYSSKEQDRIGLYYYGMRYYAPWLGRWTCTDPDGTVDGLNIYAFVVGNPTSYEDKRGETKIDPVMKAALDDLKGLTGKKKYAKPGGVKKYTFIKTNPGKAPYDRGSNLYDPAEYTHEYEVFDKKAKKKVTVVPYPETPHTHMNHKLSDSGIKHGVRAVKNKILGSGATSKDKIKGKELLKALATATISRAEELKETKKMIEALGVKGSDNDDLEKQIYKQIARGQKNISNRDGALNVFIGHHWDGHIDSSGNDTPKSKNIRKRQRDLQGFAPLSADFTQSLKVQNDTTKKITNFHSAMTLADIPS